MHDRRHCQPAGHGCGGERCQCATSRRRRRRRSNSPCGRTGVGGGMPALAPIRPGEAVITGAHRLPNRYVIHCLGPVYGVDEPASELLAACYRNALRRAEEKGIRSIAFPAISTGIFGYPMEAAARVAFTTIFEELPRLSSVKHIRFVLFSGEDQRIHAKALEETVPRE